MKAHPACLLLFLAAEQPRRVAEMTAALRRWQASVERSLAGKDYQ